MLPTLPYIFATLSIFFTQRSGVFAQQLSDTSGWALRGNQTCPAGESSCGKTAHGFVGCCPAFSPCLPQYNDVCCPPNTNCTDALVDAGPWCADPTWVLCNNNGYFCCLPGQTCYNDGNTDGCAYPGQELGPNKQVLQHIHQVPRSIALTTTTSSASGSSGSSATQPPTSSAIGSSATQPPTSSATSSSATQPPTSSKPSPANSGGLNISDMIAIGIGVPVGVATILGAWITWKMYRRGGFGIRVVPCHE